MTQPKTPADDRASMERRDFLRKVGLGAAFAAPLVASFSMNGTAMAFQMQPSNSPSGSNTGPTT